MAQHKDRLSMRHVRPSLKAAIQLYANEKGITLEAAALEGLTMAFGDMEERVKSMWGIDEPEPEEERTSSQ